MLLQHKQHEIMLEMFCSASDVHMQPMLCLGLLVVSDSLTVQAFSGSIAKRLFWKKSKQA